MGLAKHAPANSIPAIVNPPAMHCAMQLAGVFVSLPGCWSSKMRPSRLSLRAWN